jgi:hypothetical protein
VEERLTCACSHARTPVCAVAVLRMAAAAFPPRRSARVSAPPLSLAEEQAVAVLSRREAADVRRSIAQSLVDSESEGDLDSDAASDDEGAGDAEQEEEKEEEPDAAGWSAVKSVIAAPIFAGAASPSRRAQRAASPLEFLQLFLPRALMQQHAHWTTAYARQHGAELTWQTTAGEMYAFLGVHIYMGIVALPRLHMYWSALYSQPFVTSLFTRRRFKELLRYHRVAPAPVPDAPVDHLRHVRSLVATLNASFAAHYSPSQYLTLDESMAAFEGRSPIKQYMPMKPHKWGYKIWGLASDDYLLRFEVYEGKEHHPSVHGATYDLVIRITNGYQNMNHILFMDSWFTSPGVIDALKVRGILSCGSVRSNRRGLPAVAKEGIDALAQGDWIHRQKDDLSLEVWKDQKVLWLLYNHISPTATTSLNRWDEEGDRVAVQCPQSIEDYFMRARSIDIINQLHYSYLMGRKSKRSWPRLVWWLLDMCILNAFKLWSIDQAPVRQLDFREQLMFELVASLPADQKPQREGRQPHAVNALAKDHYPVRSGVERDCVQCSHQPNHRVESSFICAKCSVHLCIGECFSLHHANL